MGTKYKVFSYMYGDGAYGKCFWFRIFGYGLHFKKHDVDLLFSERYGHSKYYVFFGIRVKVLKP